MWCTKINVNNTKIPKHSNGSNLYSSMSHCYCIQYAINTSLVGQCANNAGSVLKLQLIAGTFSFSFQQTTYRQVYLFYW